MDSSKGGDDYLVEQSWKSFWRYKGKEDVDIFEERNRAYYKCSLCNTHTLIFTLYGHENVCSSCASVQQGDPIGDQRDMGEVYAKSTTRLVTKKGASAGYNAVFHVHERLAAFNCVDPTMDGDAWVLIRVAWDKYENDREVIHNKTRVTRRDISRLIRRGCEDLPSLPPRWPDTNRIHKVYMERWISIIYALTGQHPPIMDRRFYQEIEHRFSLVYKNWDFVRHHPRCPSHWSRNIGKRTVHLRFKKCHKTHNCRHNLPNYDFMLDQIVQDIVYTHREIHPQWREMLGLRKYLKRIKTSPRRKKLVGYWVQLKKYTGIPLYI